MTIKHKKAKWTNKPSEKGKKKQKQINVKLSEDLYDRLRAASDIQEHTTAQLGRILIEWALPFYERARSVEALKYLAAKYFPGAAGEAPLEQAEINLSLELVSQEAVNAER